MTGLADDLVTKPIDPTCWLELPPFLPVTLLTLAVSVCRCFDSPAAPYSHIDDADIRSRAIILANNRLCWSLDRRPTTRTASVLLHSTTACWPTTPWRHWSASTCCCTTTLPLTSSTTRAGHHFTRYAIKHVTRDLFVDWCVWCSSAMQVMLAASSFMVTQSRSHQHRYTTISKKHRSQAIHQSATSTFTSAN